MKRHPKEEQLLRRFLALAIVWWVPVLERPSGELSPADQLALGRELSRWRGPLDFLLETPGSATLDSVPSFELMTFAIPSAPADEEEERP